MRTPASYNLHFKFNYEDTRANDVYCRSYSTVGSAFNININVLEPLQHAQFVLYTNNTQTNIITSSNTFSKNITLNLNTEVDCTSTITISCYGKDEWWSDYYTYTKTISIGFFKELPVADFLCWPQYTYTAGNIPILLSASNYTLSRGMKMYGEGSTQNVNISAKAYTSYNYHWYVGSIEELGTQDGDSVFNTIPYSSTQGEYEIVPISLKITKPNTCLTVNTPNYYFDDITGEKKRHTFYISTSCEDIQLSRYRESLQVLTYDPLKIRIESTFPEIITGSESAEYYYDVYLKAALSGAELDPCYGLYGDSWRWSTFEDGVSTEDVPCTWYHMQSAGLFPKKWRFEPANNIKIQPRSPIQHNITNIKWGIYSEFWRNTITDETNNFLTLSHLTVPIIIDGKTNNAFHFSYKNDTTFFINVSVEYDSYVYGSTKVEKRTVVETLEKQIYIVPSVTLFVNNKYILTSS